MDSMKSLNKSLPSATVPPPQQLLQHFKTAALSVTNLYKTAAADQTRARQAGYQDALDDLLTFLDKKHLGLGDGEGWTVRQWATERLDATPPAQTGSDSDDERGDAEKSTDSPPPTVPHKIEPSAIQPRSSSRSISPARTDNPVPPAAVSVPYPPSNQIKSEVFAFRSSHHYPSDTEVQSLAPSTEIRQPDTHLMPPALTTTTPTVRVELIPRAGRIASRHTNCSSRHNTRSTASSRPLGTGAGSKRRIPLGEYFDIGSLGDGKDGASTSGKRSRLN